MSKKKKITAVITAAAVAVAVVICICFASCNCSIETVEEHDKKTTAETTYEVDTTDITEITSDETSAEQTDAAEESTSEAAATDSDGNTVSDNTQNDSDDSSSAEPQTEVYSYYVNDGVDKQVVTRYVTVQTTKPVTTTTFSSSSEGAKETRVVTGTYSSSSKSGASTSAKTIEVRQLKIDVSSIWNNPNVDSSVKSEISSDGIILYEYESVVVTEGKTVFDVLKLTCDNSKVDLTYTSSQYGIYVQAIGALAEKQCGSQSGWTYKVNGKTPSVSCDKYVLKDGDEIEWVYVTQA